MGSGGAKLVAVALVLAVVGGALLVAWQHQEAAVASSSSEKQFYGLLGQGGGKDSWPEVVGKTFVEAKAAILNDNPDLSVLETPYGSAVTMDYSMSRVRVYVKDGKVIDPPRVG
eukprot:jgi/Chlat1/7808/Chrsp66S07268